MTRRSRSARVSALMLLGMATLAGIVLPVPSFAASEDIVLYASEAAVRKGHWTSASSSGAAGGSSAKSTDQGWSSMSAPLASPSQYFEMTFQAPAATTYRVWLRLRAANSAKWNDSVWVQFSDATLTSGSAVYRIGTTSGLLVNLERCYDCGSSNWGWKNTAYWLSQPTEIRFASSGTHTIRVQTREDGVEIDQIVLSPSTYRSGAPGQETNDAVILPKSTSSTSMSASGSTPYLGSPFSLPGTVQARDFDNGGNDVAYSDNSSGNTGGAYRSTHVDVQDNAEGGHNVGWIGAGEWLKYTVNVSSSGSYKVRLRTASPYSGKTVTVAFDKSGISQSVTATNTGGWSKWANVEFTTTLSAGQQVMTLTFPSGGMNISRVEVEAATASGGTSGSLTPYSGSAVAVPGTIEASRFDNGGEGVAYHDTTSGNTGSAFRNTNVDIQSASGGGYNVGWTEAGEWLNYTVNVASAGSYTVQLKVASPSSGNSIQVGFNAASSVWQSVSIPNSGGWQNWTTVNLPVSLGAGVQQMTLMFNTGGVNLRSVTVSTGSTSTPTTSTPTTSTSGSGGTFRVMTWNIHHGKRKDGAYDPAGQAKYIASQNPHVVLLQEVQTWDENQPAKYENLLEQYTGVNWHRQWAPVVNSQWTEGNVVLTRLPVVSSTSFQMHATGDWSVLLANRSVAQTTASVGGVNIDFFSTHLDYANTSYRTAQLQDLMDWAQKFGARRLVGGDFNSTPGTYWINTMTSDYYDTWKEVTGSSSGGGTINGVRFDYLFWSKDTVNTITATKVYLGSTTMSDHLPVIADYTVKP